MEPVELIKLVKQRPAIWSPDYRDDKKIATAWRQICKIAWPDFHTRTVDDKRNKCLELQKQWKGLQQSYVRDRLRQQSGSGRVSRGQYYDLLSFLAPTVAVDTKCSTPVAGPSNGQEPPRVPAAHTHTPVPAAAGPPTTPSKEAEADEDRQFLMSLVSFMQEVPRSRKLALRTELMQVIARYTQDDGSAARRPPPFSQEY